MQYRLKLRQLVTSIGGTEDFAKRIERVGVSIEHLEAAVAKASAANVKSPPAFLTTTLIRAGYSRLRGES